MKYFPLIMLLLITGALRASHIVGGEIYYDYLGNNNYRFYISVYRDCNSSGASFDDPLSLAVYTPSGTLVQEVAIPFPGSTNVPVVFNNPCVTPPNNICTENAVYVTTINLPPTAAGYVISYQRCCRGPNITNIINPDNMGFTLTCNVPGTANNNYINSSARFNDYPPLLLCNNEDLIFDHSATDPDGDQLVYSLVTPYSGGSSLNPAPSPSPPPPYNFVGWSAGYSAANPLGPGATISINPTTGLLTASPNLLGLFVVGIQVEEIRNGVVINRTIRDFLFRVFNCDLQLEALLPNQTDLPDFVSYCDGLTINFVNDSYGGTNYAWDFGVPGITTDVSTAFEPSYTYPAPGQYQAMLVVNPGWPCTDTAFMDIVVNNEILLNVNSNDSLCIFSNSFDFVATSTGPAGTTYSWDFGPNGTPGTGSGASVNGVVFNTTGNIDVYVTASFNSCEAKDTHSVYIFPEPTASMNLPSNIECEGLTIDMDGVSQNANNFHWDFGVNGIASDTSNVQDPTYTFPGPGTYTITFVAGSGVGCADTATADITLNEPLVVSFTSEDSLCFTENSFNFDGTLSGPPGFTFVWDFGPFASIPTSTDEDVFGVHFSTTGAIPITLSSSFENCAESVTKEIYIFKEPNIDFTIAPGLQCVPFNAQFIDLSFAETTIYYSWDFGDGNTSNLQNPTNLYTVPGNYVVTLSIHTDHGCIDTLSLTQADLVNVRPKPTANFIVDPDYTDICHSVVQFTDLSEGAASWFYWFDDSTSFSHEQSPAHLYFTDGHHYPYQIVTSEYGCKDTTRSQLFIEPFTLYAPNTFTPDGDEFNNTFLPIVYLPVEEWKLEVFNRWGQLVFVSEDVDFGWDGTGPNGRMVEDGTYAWKLTFISCEPMNPERIKTGHITVLH